MSKSFDNQEAVLLEAKDIIVLLDCTLNEQLELEGLARDVVRLLQQTRKDADCHISAHIDVVMMIKSDRLKQVISVHKQYIQAQTLCSTLDVVDNIGACKYRQKGVILDDEIEVGIK